MAFADFNEIDDDKPFLATRIVRLGMHSAPLIATHSLAAILIK